MIMNKMYRLSITMMMMLMTIATWAYKVTWTNAEGNPAITAKYSSTNIVAGDTEVTSGLTVILTVAEHGTKYLTGLTVQSDVPASNATARRRAIAIQGDVEVRQTGDFTYEFTMPIGNVTITPTFGDRKDINSGTYAATISLAESSHVFDWLAHTPVISNVVANSTTLTEGTDYTVDAISSMTNVSSQTITIRGKGMYKGTATTTYQITPLSIAGASIQLSKVNTVFTHINQKPVISGVYLNGQTLYKSSDYIITTDLDAENAYLNKGNYTITITGTGNFEGTATTTYTITQMPISTCTISGETSHLYDNTIWKPELTINDGVSNLTVNTDFTISYSNSSSREVGTYTLTITAKEGSNYSGSRDVTYYITSSGVTIENIADQTYTGSAIEPTIVVKDGSQTLTKGTHYDVVYSNNINVGLATVYAIGKGSYSFNQSKIFNIVPKSVSVDGITLTLSSASFTYNTNTQKPTVTVKDGNTTLKENVDYTLSNPGYVNVGNNYTATITGIGNYKDDKTSSAYAINTLSLAGAEITLGANNYVYDGTAKTPTVQQVKIGNIVIPSTDYTPEYSNNTAAGTATVTISPKTSTPINLSGSASTTFTISKKPVSDLTITLSATEFTYNGSEQKPTVTVKDGETTLTQDTDYTLTYSTGSTVVGSYFITITGTDNYTGDIVKTYVINYGTSDADFSVTVSGTYTYNGSAHEPVGTGGSPAVVVKKGETTLTQGTDYTLSYTNNINAGTATVTATGKGNYQFIQTGTFTIQPKEITAGMAALNSSSFVYNGALQKPTVTITDGTKTLVEGTDYTLVNDGGTNVASYNATITGIGNYTTGEGLAKAYSITALSLTGATVTLDPLQSYVYDGTEKRPGVQQVKVGNVVVPAADYAVTYPKDATPTDDDNDNVNAGTNTAKVYINPSATGNLSVSKTKNFSITKKPLSSEMITLSSTETDWQSNSFVYNQTLRKPTVTVSDIPTGLTSSIIAASDYTITNEGGTAVGVYYVTVTATTEGNYSGTIKVPYSIVSDNSETDVDVALNAGDNLTYTGNPITRTITVTKGTTGLTEGTDYEVIYNNNTNVGQATITILGKGNYHFVKYVNFSIAARPMTTANGMAITLSATSFEYNGSVQKPNVTVTYTKPGAAAATTLTEGIDYSLSNPGATNVSTGNKAVITGIGNFSGTMDSPTYSITAKALTDAVITLYPLANPVYDGTAKEPAVQKVTVGGQVYTSGYTVSYSNNINAGNTAVVTVSSDGTSTFSGSASTNFTISPKPLADDMAALAYTSVAYDGTAKEPGVTMTDMALPATFDSKVLAAGTDYTVTYTAEHTTPGQKAATITGKGNYTGTITKPYTIVGASDVTIDWTDGDAVAAYTYDGTAKTPAITVTKGATTLTSGTDYTVTYSDNIHAGVNTAVVTVTGKGNYDFTQTKTFSIAQKEMTDAMVALSSGSFTYNGNIQKPTVTVTDGAIITSNDYSISNDGNINAGNYTVTVTAIATGNYSGSGSQSYTINPLSITSGEVALSYDHIVFNGSEQKPSVRTVFANGHQLTATTDYSISWPGSDYINQGEKTITVTGTGNYTGSKNATYTIDQKDVTSNMIKIANENLTYTGSAQTADVTIEDLIGTNNIITTSDYTMTNAGGTAVGQYDVQIVGKGNYKGTATKQYSIVTAGSTGFTVEAIAAQTYTGLPLTPAVTVKKAGTETVLTQYTDYSLVWENNTNAGANSASVTVTGLGNYGGTKTVYFTINPKPLTDATITATLLPTSFAYTGSTQKPDVTVKDGTAKTLVLNTDYMLVNDGGVAQNTYNVTITGIGNYTGELTPSYSIGQQSLTGAAVILNRLDSYVYDGNAKTPSVSEVKIGSDVIPATNYDVSYSSNVNVGTATITVTGKGNCSGTATATFAITPKMVNSDMITISPTSFNYDNTLHKPSTITVKDGAMDLTLDTDYTLTNSGGTNLGAYSVTITGKGNYTGTASKSFSIVANDASGFSIDDIADQTYDGSPKTPAPVVKEGTNTLSSDYYSVAYLNNINAGVAVVTVTGKNGYSFVKSQIFTIKPKVLTTDMLALSSDDFIYNGGVRKPTVTMTDKNTDGNSIMTSNDYSVTNEGGTNIGSYSVVVNGQNNYTGSINKSFTISELSLSSATITLASLASYVYDGAEKKPAVLLVKVGELAVPSSAYDVAYSNNIQVGASATVTVTAKTGTNFKDGNSTTFSIERKPITSDMIILSNENFTYNGETQKPTVTIKDGETTLALTTDYTVENPGGKDVANYWVNISGQGNYTGNAAKQYSIVAENSAAFDVSTITSQETYTGLPIEPEVTVWKANHGSKLVLGTDYLVTYSDNVNAGTATVTVTGQGNYGGTRRITFTILPKPIAADEITLSSTAYNFNGTEQKPLVTVTDGVKSLKENAEFTVDYPSDIKSQGSKTVTIKGIGNYTGTETKEYTIGTLTIANATATLTYANTVYNGTIQRPAVQTVYANGIQLTENVDYTITYPTDADATPQGDKSIVVNGIGNYSGSKTVTYHIAPKEVTSSMMNLSSENLVYTGSNLKPDVTVKDGNVTLIAGTDYTIVNDGGTSYGTYNVVITGKGNYTGEAIKTYSIVRKDVSDFTVAAIADLIFDGTAKQPLPEVKDHLDKVMTKGVDFLISYNNNTNVGTATATVTGINSYSGTKSVEFQILPKSLTVTDGTIDVSLSKTSLPYTGNTQRPEVIVKDGSKTLVMNTDYTLINDGGVNVDSYEVKITGIGNYKDVVTKTFSIGNISLEDATVVLNRLDSYVYDGTAKTPSVSEVKVEASFISAANYTISYSNNVNVGVATVTVTATETGNCSGSATATFSITPKTVNSDMIAFNSVIFNYDGNSHKPEKVTVMDGTTELALETDYTLTNEGGTAMGTYSVAITGKGNYSGTASKSFSIVVNDGSTFAIEPIADCTYDGSEQRPAPVVKDGATILGTDKYTVTYLNNINAGTAVVTVTGTNGYSFIKSQVFTIHPKTLTADMMNLSATSFVYNGNLQKPVVTITDNNAVITVNDYVISNEGGTNFGTYRVVANGQGNYTGSIEKTYTIGQFSLAEATLTLVPMSNATYDGNAKTPAVSEVKVGTVLISADNYIVSYDNNIHAGTATVTVTAKEPSNLSGSNSTTFTIHPKTVTSDMIELSPAFLNYDGSLQKPSLVTVKDGTLPMTKDTDYTLTNEGGTDVGTYQVTITGVGDYQGTASKAYSIVANDASGFYIDTIDDFTYDGQKKTPAPVVKDEEGTIIPADGYSVTYLNNVNAGTAFVTVAGKNGYSFIKSQMFTIQPKTLTEDMVTLSATNFIYNGSIQRPVVTIADNTSGTSILMTSSDYVVMNDGGVNIGTYQVIVNGQSNYTGSIEKTFSISLQSLASATITLGANSFIYDGTEKKPLIQLVTVGQVIVSSSDYAVAYSNNVNVGTATVTISGKGNYTESQTVNFDIMAKSLTDDMVTLSSSTFVYNGDVQKPTVTVKDGQNILEENTDYRLSDYGAAAPGQYSITITGIGNYTSTTIVAYTIESPDMIIGVDVTDQNGRQAEGSVNIRPVGEEGNDVEIVSMNYAPDQLPTTSVTIPALCTSNGKTYAITGIAEGAFVHMSDLKDIYLPETDEPLTIGENAFPEDATIHVPLALLDDYALMPSLSPYYQNSKVMTTVKAAHRFWTFSSGVDVAVPSGVSVYVVHERNDNTVTILELTDEELTYAEQRIIKANNGVLFECTGYYTTFDLIASPVRMESGSTISTEDSKDYGTENCLVPVIEATHYEADGYYLLKNNEFYRIKAESENIKVPAGKAVLYLPNLGSTRFLGDAMELVDQYGTPVMQVTDNSDADQEDIWYDLNGRQLDRKPVERGIYIHNNKKVIIK